MLLRDHRLEVRELGVLSPAFPDVGHGHHAGGAVRLAVGVLVDPGEPDVELVGRVGEGAEDPEAAGPAHGGDDVAAVREGEDRELDPELLGDRRPHVAGTYRALFDRVNHLPTSGSRFPFAWMPAQRSRRSSAPATRIEATK